MNFISNLKQLQLELKKKDIDIFIINRSDEFLSEYISPNAERLQFATNFSGSAGKAIILQNEAFLYVDGRYTFQANEQLNIREIKPKHLKKVTKYFSKLYKHYVIGKISKGVNKVKLNDSINWY